MNPKERNVVKFAKLKLLAQLSLFKAEKCDRSLPQKLFERSLLEPVKMRLYECSYIFKLD